MFHTCPIMNTGSEYATFICQELCQLLFFKCLYMWTNGSCWPQTIYLVSIITLSISISRFSEGFVQQNWNLTWPYHITQIVGMYSNWNLLNQNKSLLNYFLHSKLNNHTNIINATQFISFTFRCHFHWNTFTFKMSFTLEHGVSFTFTHIQCNFHWNTSFTLKHELSFTIKM